MKFALALLQDAPSQEQLDQLKIALDPIMRHGRRNISYLSSLDAFDWTIIILYFGILLLLAVLGIMRLRMVYQFWRYRHIKPEPLRQYKEEELPRITVQLPLFNELYVAERLIDSIAAQVVEKYARQGFDITYIHRLDRMGFKAGALENGMKTAKGELIAIFDADFTPRSDCLRKMVDYFTNERIGAVQMRWSHINANYSLFTRIQEVLLDSHFVIEQTSRNRTGAFFNFNGTAGMWRRDAIEWSGGWQHDTLTEDTDLSFRAQLMGWKFVYLLDQDAPAELPVEINAFKAQQRRWAKGLVQVGLKLMPRIWKHPKLTLQQKLELFFRLFGNCAAILMIFLSILHIPVLIVRFNQGLFHLFVLDMPIMIFATFSVICFYGTTIYYRFPQEKWRYWLIPLCMATGIGLVFSNARAVLEALCGIKSSFVRTPKYRVESSKDTWLRAAMKYRRKKGWLPLFELTFAFYFLFAVYYAYRSGIYATIPWLMLFLIGYGYMALMSLFQGSFRKVIDSFRRS